MAQTSYIPSQMANPITVISPNFLSPSPVDLVIVRKLLSMSDGRFVVTDVKGNFMFKVKGKILSLHERRVLFDAVGNPLISFQKKIKSMHHKWEAFRGISSEPKDLIFSAKQSSMLQWKTKLNVFMANNIHEGVCDFKVKGSFFDQTCTIYAGEETNIIAQMHKKHTFTSVALGRDLFCVTVYPNVDYAFIVALVVILDEINDDI